MDKVKKVGDLCNDGQNFINLMELNTYGFSTLNTLREEGSIQAYTNKGKLTNLNELEWVDGKIYANRYQKNGVAIINPQNGAIEAVIDFKALKTKVTKHKGLDVLQWDGLQPKNKNFICDRKTLG